MKDYSLDSTTAGSASQRFRKNGEIIWWYGGATAQPEDSLGMNVQTMGELADYERCLTERLGYPIAERERAQFSRTWSYGFNPISIWVQGKRI